MITLTCIAGIFYLTAGRMLSRWWFGDDPIQFAAVRDIPNPLRFFLDLKFGRTFGSGRGVVPMQMLDYWIDSRLPVPMPLGGYLHTLATCVAATVGIFFVLRRVTQNERLSFVGSVLWMLMPPTFATGVYLSMRHYVEGLVFACVVFCIAASPRRLNLASTLILVLCSIAAMLCKEIYAGLVPAMLVAFGLTRRNRWMVASALLLGLAYAAYRTASVGASMQYVGAMPSVKDYLHYLAVLPYTFHETLLAYPVFLVAIWGTVRYYRTGGQQARREFWIFASLLGATMFILIPVAVATYVNVNIPTGWLRTSFLPDTLALVWLVLIVHRLAPTDRSVGILVALGLTLVPGLLRCFSWRDSAMGKQEIEGRFFLAQPRRLLYSADQDPWFYDGLRNWYHADDAAVLLKERPDPAADLKQIRRLGTVWSYQNGEVRPNPEITGEYQRRLEATAPKGTPSTAG